MDVIKTLKKKKNRCEIRLFTTDKAEHMQLESPQTAEPQLFA